MLKSLNYYIQEALLGGQNLKHIKSAPKLNDVKNGDIIYFIRADRPDNVSINTVLKADVENDFPNFITKNGNYGGWDYTIEILEGSYYCDYIIYSRVRNSKYAQMLITTNPYYVDYFKKKYIKK